ncbi:hypothetical protein OROMI_010714 [Orobanche minor]
MRNMMVRSLGVARMKLPPFILLSSSPFTPQILFDRSKHSICSRTIPCIISTPIFSFSVLDINQDIVLEQMECFDLLNKIWGVKDDDNKRRNGGDFIRATLKDLTIMFLMFRKNQESTEGLFEKWASFDDENTYLIETHLLDKISHLHQRYLLNLDGEIVASTRTLDLMAFVVSDEIWGNLYHDPVQWIG